MARIVVARRSRWTAEQAEQILTDQERSGLSVRAFAERHGLDPERLYRWRRTLGQEHGRRVPVASASFIEVARSGVAIAEHRALVAGFEIALGSGVVVRVGSSFEPESLRRLLSVVTETLG